MLRREIPVEWDPVLIYSYMISCVEDDKGVPRFMVQVFGMPLAENTAILVCRDFDENDLLESLYVTNIPDYIYNIIEQHYHRGELAEWKKVLASILEPSVIPKLRELKPHVIKEDDIPRMITYSMESKVKKVPTKEALEILNEIEGPETFYDIAEKYLHKEIPKPEYLKALKTSSTSSQSP